LPIKDLQQKIFLLKLEIMPSNKSTSVVFTKEVQAIKDKLAPVFGLKKLLSAGLILFNELSDAEQKDMIARVGKSEPNTSIEEAIESLKQSLADAPPGDITRILSPEHSALLREVVSILKPDSPKEKSHPKTG
jgi:hypothetical protein